MKVEIQTDYKRKIGFTLIELLVVISIIALLLGVLLPSLGKARRQARTVVCRANLKPFALAFVAYSNDFRGKLPPAYYGNYSPPYWFFVIEPYIGAILAQEAQGGLSAVGSATGVNRCPNAEPVVRRFHADTTDYGVNLVHLMWNGRSANFNKIHNPAGAFLLADAIFDPTSSWNRNPPTWRSETIVCPLCYPNLGDKPLLRSDRRLVACDPKSNNANVLFCDGHIGSVDVDIYNPKDSSLQQFYLHNSDPINR